MNKNILIAAAVLVLLGAGYWFMRPKAIEPSLTQSVTVNAAQVKFQTLANQLGPISFDTSLFADPRFAVLVDLSVTVTPEPSGRLDPFAPLGGITRDEREDELARSTR